MKSKSLFLNALYGKNSERPPVWFMRQAGRYHSHYQALKKQHSFMELCKKPELACEVTMGPIQDFDFDAAILFSDLLFPLEALGMGLEYSPGPKLDWHLDDLLSLKRLKLPTEGHGFFSFQAEALKKIRARLSSEKGLLGFVGSPLTLFFYAAEGSHQGELEKAKNGLKSGLFEGFSEILRELLAQNMAMQASAGADAVAIFDTCGGEIDPETYAQIATPQLAHVIERFHQLCPNHPVVYYSKNTGPAHWKALRDLPIQTMGIDWNQSISKALREWAPEVSIQGNFDSNHLLLPHAQLEPMIRKYFDTILKETTPEQRGAWICGLGHGVLQTTPEENVRLFLRIQKEVFG